MTPSACRWSRISVSIAAALGSAAGASAATFSAGVQGVSIWDDNLFRMNAATAKLQSHGGSDNYRIVQPIVSVEDESGSLTYTASAAASKAWFAHNSFLNNTGYALQGHATYTGERNQFDIQASTQRRLTAFEDLRGSFKSIQKVTNARGEASQSFAGYFRAVGTLSFAQSTSTAAIVAVNDYRRYGGSFGLGYYSPAGNILSVQGEVRRSDGLNDRIAVIGSTPMLYRADYTDKSVFARLLYQPSVLFQVDGRIGYTWHNDRSGVAGDFSGITGSAAAHWSPLRALTIDVKAARQFESNSGIFSNGVRESEVTGAVTAAVTETLSAKVSAGRHWRRFRYDLLTDNPFGAHSEQFNEVAATLSYTPTEMLTLSGSYTHDSRTSSAAIYRFNANVVMLSATLSFGGSRQRP